MFIIIKINIIIRIVSLILIFFFMLYIKNKVTFLKKFPTRSFSRAWGAIHFMELPVWMRAPAYKLYAYLFNCNLDEMENKDLTSYPNLSAFFMRTLAPGVRPIDSHSLLVRDYFFFFSIFSMFFSLH